MQIQTSANDSEIVCDKLRKSCTFYAESIKKSS